MINYGKLTEDIIEKFKEIVGEKNIVTESEKLIDYSHDEIALTELYNFPDIVVKPKNCQEISEIVKICNDLK